MEEDNCKSSKKSLNSSDCYCININKLSIQDLKTAKDSRSPSLEENEVIYNLIHRKTKRGRKEKISIPKNKLKCGICLELSDYLSEDLISCSTCKCLFHISCYNQSELTVLEDSSSSYKCIRCVHALNIGKPITDFHCFICGNSNGVLNRNNITKDFYHQICLDLLSELKGYEGEDICKDKIRKWRYKNSCRYCGEKLCKEKAVIKCKNPKCKQFFHIPCSIEKGMIFDLKFMKKYYKVNKFSDIPFYCSNHNKKISFLYKDYVLNKNQNQNEKKSIYDIINNKESKTFFNKIQKYKKKKNNNDRIKKIKKKFVITNNNNNNNNIKPNIEENSSINKSKNKENNFFHESDTNIINNNPFETIEKIVDFEEIIKDNMNRNIFPDYLELNHPLLKSHSDNNFNKESELNSIHFFH
jgi:hypothetical protein